MTNVIPFAVFFEVFPYWFLLLSSYEQFCTNCYFQMQDLTDAMHEKKIPKGCYVIREGVNSRPKSIIEIIEFYQIQWGT